MRDWIKRKTMNEIAKKIRTFIFDNFLFDANEDALANDDSLLEKGIIDSTGVLELVEWLEDDFGLEIDDDDLIPENLDSVNNLAAFISSKT